MSVRFVSSIDFWDYKNFSTNLGLEGSVSLCLSEMLLVYTRLINGIYFVGWLGVQGYSCVLLSYH
jgi:hypothetical protein